MENLNTQMDDQLKNRVAELNRANDENRDGRLDAAACFRTQRRAKGIAPATEKP